MRVDFLADYPAYAADLALPLLEYWSFALPEDTLEVRRAKLDRYMNRQGLPIAWVAHDTDHVFGTAALREHDLEGREDLTPWLSGVFVMPRYRGAGIGSALCLSVERYACTTGVERLYLFTLDHERMYARLGWQHEATELWRGHSCSVMVKPLTPSNKLMDRAGGQPAP